jgi:gluconokinase
VILLMGVSGVGKSTVGTILAKQLGWTFADADDFFSAENVQKMHAGIPLNDDDRRPWLEQLGATIRSWLDSRECAILACSALKERYREMLDVNDPRVKLVFLKGGFDQIAQRLHERKGHYMNPNLLQSQFEALEPPSDALAVDVSQSPEKIAEFIRRALAL